MHSRACVSLSISWHMIMLARLSDMSSAPLACIILSQLTSCSMMNPTSLHSRSSNSPFLPDFSFVESSSVLSVIIEPPKRLWFCALDLIIVPIASSVSTWSFGSTVMVAANEIVVSPLIFWNNASQTLHHLDFSRWHRWQIIIGHKIAEDCHKFENTGNATAHLIHFTANSRHHLIWVGSENECNVYGVLPKCLVKDALAHHKPYRVNYNEIVKAKIYTIWDRTQRRLNCWWLLKLKEWKIIRNENKWSLVGLPVPAPELIFPAWFSTITTE
jgi:hypothetical protein